MTTINLDALEQEVRAILESAGIDYDSLPLNLAFSEAKNPGSVIGISESGASELCLFPQPEYELFTMSYQITGGESSSCIREDYWIYDNHGALDAPMDLSSGSVELNLSGGKNYGFSHIIRPGAYA